ncbi:MAG TPA: ATP-dependent sacrificial sulfur transferase LarE [Methanomicrobiales archaeon]|nr:ATP-dependent sacrificial sulfur transferase LarE [Methanomicrobiales archaeon]
MSMEDKEELLVKSIRKRGSMLIAFSGGVDSSLLAGVTMEVLGDRCRAVLLDSPVVPRFALQRAKETAEGLGIALEVIPVPLMDEKTFLANPADRCCFCKKASARVLKKRAGDLGFASIADGINASDLGEHRPGILASSEEGIVHPFVEAGITKTDIRAIAREKGYSFWDRPSAACLSSRIPYGDEITLIKLRMIETAEDHLRERGFIQARVRLHGPVARIEVAAREMERLWNERSGVQADIQAAGFRYVTVDLAGYRSGSMDEVL